MRIESALLCAFLLLPASVIAAAPGEQAGTAAPATLPTPQPAITRVSLRNVGADAAIVLLSRRSPQGEFHRGVRLVPGESVQIDVPRLPQLRAAILRFNDLAPPRARDDRDRSDRRTTALALGLGLALAGQRRDREERRQAARSDDDRDRRELPPETARPPSEERHPQEEVPASVPDEDRAHATEQHSGRRGDLGTALALGILQSSRRRDPEPPTEPPAADDAFPGELVVLDSGDGSGSEIVHGLELGVSVSNTSAEEDHDRAVSLAILESTHASAAGTPCYCGPDMTAAYVAALKRVRDRIEALPDSEKGAWDGAMFLSSNGGSIDERVRPARKPGASATGDEESGWLCPTGTCADLPGPGGTTMSLFGHCLPQHVGNDIMYGFVAALLGVPWPVQTAGGYYAQYASYSGSIDPPQSRSAYKIGNYIADLDADEYTVANVRERIDQAWRFRELGGSLAAIEQSYPALAQCATCPADYIEPGQLLRDWSKSEWILNDGSRASPLASEGRNP